MIVHRFAGPPAALALALVPGCIIVATNDERPPAPRLTVAEAEALPDVPAGGLPTIREKYAPAFAGLEPGMSTQAFRAAFGDAAFVEQRSKDGVTVDAYSLSLNQRYRYRWHGNYYARTQNQEVWFYFQDGKLSKWGDPHQWP